MGRLTNAEKIRRFRNKRKDDVAYRNSESKRVEKCRKVCVDEMSEFEKGEYKIKLERDRESAVLKRKQGKKIPTLPKLHLPLLPPPLYLISIHTTPSNHMKKL